MVEFVHVNFRLFVLFLDSWRVTQWQSGGKSVSINYSPIAMWSWRITTTIVPLINELKRLARSQTHKHYNRPVSFLCLWN